MANQNQHTKIFSEFQGFWILPKYAPNIIAFQKHFQALDDDIIVASHPKAGTTWLKALVFTIVNRTRYTTSNSPLNSKNPHDLVPYFEFVLYAQGQNPELTTLPSPRLFSTHLPLSALPQSVKQSNTRIVYVTRNPLDVIISFWHHMRKRVPDWPLEECFEVFCKGEEWYGPFWDHVLGYWKESLDNKNKVLFLRYEDLKENPILQMKKIAEFIGFPFSMEEERTGAIEEIAKFCSFSNMKNMTVNMNGKLERSSIELKILFRKGEVGDYVNYLSPVAIERFTKILEEKLSGSELTFDFACT